MGKTFIDFREDGSVRIAGGLIFHDHEFSIYAERRVIETPRHQCEDNVFITILPRWWQLDQWYRLLKMLRAHTKTPNVELSGDFGE